MQSFSFPTIVLQYYIIPQCVLHLDHIEQVHLFFFFFTMKTAQNVFYRKIIVYVHFVGGQKQRIAIARALLKVNVGKTSLFIPLFIDLFF